MNNTSPRSGRAGFDSQDLTTPLRPLSVLVVDDQPDAAESMAELLSLCGCEARVATYGEEALDSAALHLPDLILLDLDLPGLDGWEVARQLRKQAAEKQPFIVALTGYSDEDDRCRSPDAGIDIHLVKPVHPRPLIRLLAWVRELRQPPECDRTERDCPNLSRF